MVCLNLYIPSNKISWNYVWHHKIHLMSWLKRRISLPVFVSWSSRGRKEWGRCSKSWMMSSVSPWPYRVSRPLFAVLQSLDYDTDMSCSCVLMCFVLQAAGTSVKSTGTSFSSPGCSLPAGGSTEERDTSTSAGAADTLFCTNHWSWRDLKRAKHGETCPQSWFELGSVTQTPSRLGCVWLMGHLGVDQTGFEVEWRETCIMMFLIFERLHLNSVLKEITLEVKFSCLWWQIKVFKILKNIRNQSIITT